MKQKTVALLLIGICALGVKAILPKDEFGFEKVDSTLLRGREEKTVLFTIKEL